MYPKFCLLALLALPALLNSQLPPRRAIQTPGYPAAPPRDFPGHIWAGLPQPFASGIEAALPIGDNTFLLFSADQFAVYDVAAGQVAQAGRLQDMKGWPSNWTSVTAAVRMVTGEAVIFSGNELAWFSLKDFVFTAAAAPVTEWAKWPWPGGPDAAAEVVDGTALFIKGGEYVSYTADAATGKAEFSPMGRLQDWPGWPQGWTDGVQGAVNGGDGNLYFFRGPQYAQYRMQTRDFDAPLGFGTGTSHAAAAVQPQAPPQPPAPPQTQAQQPQADPPAPQQPPVDVQAQQAQQIEQLKAQLQAQQKAQQRAQLIAETRALKERERFEAQRQAALRSSQPAQPGPGPAAPDETARCMEEVQGKVAWDKAGNKTWAPGNLRNLCAASPNAAATIACFQGQIAQHNDWSRAIGACKSNVPAPPTNLQPVVQPSAPPPPVQPQYQPQQPPQQAPPAPPETAVRPAQRPGTFRDDIPDFVPELGVGRRDLISGLDFVGDGYNIVFADPTTYGASSVAGGATSFRKGQRAILLTKSGPTNMGGNKFLAYGVRFSSGGSGKTKSGNEVIKSLSDFRSNFDASFGVNTGVEGIASFSGSGAFGRINKATTGSEQIYIYQSDVVTLHSLELDLTFQEDGVMYRQKLNPNFRQAVAALPPSGACNAYEAILDIYGTHFASGVTYGGRFNRLTTVLKSTFDSSNQDSQSFTASVQATVKKVNIGATSTVASGNTTNELKLGERETTEIWSSGGGGSQNYETWVNQVENNPAPAHMKFENYAALLTPVFFPDDPAIGEKSRMMTSCTGQYLRRVAAPYIKDNTPPDGDFFVKKPRKFFIKPTFLMVDAEGPEAGPTSEFYGVMNIGVFKKDGTSLLTVPFWIKPALGDCGVVTCLGKNQSARFDYPGFPITIQPGDLDGAYVKMFGEVKEFEDWPVPHADLGREDARGVKGKLELRAIGIGATMAGSLQLGSTAGDVVTFNFEIQGLPTPK